MSNYCKLCGLDTTSADFKSPIKQMCLNCKSFVEEKEGVFACVNNSVLLKGVSKILDKVPEGYEVESIKLKQLVLKDPTKKCGEYDADFDVILSAVKGVFGYSDEKPVDTKKVKTEEK